MDAILRTSGLCAGYGAADVLRGVSFALERGEVCALLGAPALFLLLCRGRDAGIGD